MEPDETNERRRSLRFPVALPLHAKGWIPDGTAWEEDTTTDDVSEGGVSFLLGREVRLGQVLRVRVPLPRRLRPFDREDPEFVAFALVRRITREGTSSRIGVMYFGADPPRGFLDRPWARFLLPSDPPEADAPPSLEPSAESADAAPGRDAWRALFPDAYDPEPNDLLASDGAPEAERRKSPRVPSTTSFTLEAQDEWGTVLQEELTVATNLSRGGACLRTTLPFRAGEVLLLQEAGGAFATRVIVCAVSGALPDRAFLHVEFLDGETPPRLLA